MVKGMGNGVPKIICGLRDGVPGERGRGDGLLYVNFELCDHELAVMNLWIYAYVISELSPCGWFMGLIGFSCT